MHQKGAKINLPVSLGYKEAVFGSAAADSPKMQKNSARCEAGAVCPVQLFFGSVTVLPGMR